MKKKIIITLIVTLVIGLILLIGITISNKNKIAILGYHGILPKKINTSGDNLIVDQEKFEEELKLLKKLGYKTMTLDEYYCWKIKKCYKDKSSVLITFDDGYINNYEYAFNLLKKYDMNAVVFLVGSYTEGDSNIHMNKEMIEKAKIEYPNIEFASHSYNLHFHSDKKYDEVIDDADKMKDIVKTNYYAYPYGDYNDEYIKALKDRKYKLAFTFGPNREHRKSDLTDDNFKIPRLNISKDMPMYKFLLRLILPI